MGVIESAPSPRLRLRISPRALTALREGHPWIFSDSIQGENRPGVLGELAALYDHRDRFQGLGLYDPDSPIRVRVLYTGKARPLDAEWWRHHLRQPLDLRAGMFDAQTTGYRLCSGESDGWPGLVLDRYADTLVLKLYAGAWLPRLAEIVELLRAELPHKRLVLRLSRILQAVVAASPTVNAAAIAAAPADGQVLFGPPVEEGVIFLENGLHFEADVLRGQKTGFFLDQRENRHQVGLLARGREVLNAFSFSGGFSVYAARGGAKSVTDVDLSAHALESAQRNMSLNRELHAVRGCRHTAVQADVFEWLRASRTPQFDLVVLDPPSLARREAQRAEAVRAYERLNLSGVHRLRKNGILVAASCSAHVTEAEFFGAVRKAARASGRGFRELQTTGHPPDHPATFPEAHYLKCIYLRFD